MLVAQLCLTLCSPPGLSDHGILQARILEWVAIPSPESSVGCNPKAKICFLFRNQPESIGPWSIFNDSVLMDHVSQEWNLLESSLLTQNTECEFGVISAL